MEKSKTIFVSPRGNTITYRPSSRNISLSNNSWYQKGDRESLFHVALS